jgi:hypothetical protein
MDPITFQPVSGETLIYKFESDGTVPNEVHCLTIINYDTGTLSRYAPAPGYPPIWDGIERLAGAKLAISHTVFHYRVVTKFFGVPLPNYYDTFAEARKRLPDESHKLTDWARAFRIPLSNGRANTNWTPAVQSRCDAGASVIERLYHELTAPVEA